MISPKLASGREAMSSKLGGGTTTGPTATAAAAQKQKSLIRKLGADISNIVNNFSHLVSVSRVRVFSPNVTLNFKNQGFNLINPSEVNDPPVRNSQDCFQIDVRAARISRAADSLLKLASELKQTAVFSGFAALNENVDRRITMFDREKERTERLLETNGEEAMARLKELESHYYGSVMRRAGEAE